MLSLLLATLLTQATMSPTSDLSTNRVRATGAAGARPLRDHLRTLPDVSWDAVTVGSAVARPSGASVSRGLNAVLGDEKNVLFYGADPTGVATADAAIQAALDDVPATGGGVFIPPGTYKITKSLLPKANTTIRCSGYGTTLKMADGGWDSYAQTAEYGDHMGLISILRSNVRVTNCRIVGSMTATILIPGQPEYRYNPQLLFYGNLTGMTGTTIDHNWFEDNLWNGVWPAGYQWLVTHTLIDSNVFKNIGRTVDYGGNPDRVALQLNDWHTTATNNRFERCGNAISATAPHLVVSGNQMRDCWQGILIGDAANLHDVIVSNNKISINVVDGSDWADPEAVQGIAVNAGGEPFGRDVSILGNSIDITLATTAVRGAQGIQTNGVDILIKGNTITFDVETAWSTSAVSAIGILTFAAGNSGTRATIQNNTVRAFSTTGNEFTNGKGIGMESWTASGKTLTINSSGNEVKGFEAGSAMCVWWVPQSGSLSLYVNGDRCTGGQMIYGDRSVGGASNYNVPVWVAWTSSSGPLSPQAFPMSSAADRVFEPAVTGTTTSISVDASKYDLVIFRSTESTSFTMNAPTNPQRGQVLRIMDFNQSGGALGTITWTGGVGGWFLAGGSWTRPASSTNRSVQFIYDGARWLEVNRSAADVPNS